MRKTFIQFAENDQNESQYETIVLNKKGIGWEARYPGIETTMGVGSTPEEALHNLTAKPDNLGFEDWEREGNKMDHGFEN